MERCVGEAVQPAGALGQQGDPLGVRLLLDAGEDDDVKILANNMPVAEGTVVVNGNRIAVEVKRLLPKSPDMR